MERKIFFYGGIFAPLVFLLNDIIGGLITPDFNYITHAVSELTQSGSVYTLGPVLFFVSAVLGFVFGVGLFFNYKDRRNKLLFVGSIIIVFMAISNALTGTIFPMDPFGAEMTFPGMMHIILVAIVAVLIFPMLLLFGIGLHREKQWKSFKIYSIVTFIIIFIFGGLSPVLIMNEIGLLGLFERIVIYSYQLWIFILAAKLIKEQGVSRI